MDLITSFFQPCFSWAGNALFRQIGYLKAKTITKELEEATRDLAAKRNDIQMEIEAAAREQKQCTEQVRRWLQKVTEPEGEVTAIQSDYERNGCGLLGARIPNCWSSYRTGRRASKLLAKVIALEKQPADFGEILMPQPPEEVQEMNLGTSTQEGTVMASYIKKVRGYLEEEEGGCVIGIWGMGGVGKTTLLKEINNVYLHNSSAAGAKFFDHVIFVVVSKDHSLEALQKNIMKRLGLSSSDDDAESQAAVIFNFLKEKNFLLLLDDVWKAINLIDIGIPDPALASNNIGRQQRRKVVVTTRSNVVCGGMDSRKRIKMECLGEEESWNLFKKKVGEDMLDSHPHLVSLAREVAKKCDGLPLALTVIGRAMSTMQTPEAWNCAIAQLKKAQHSNISGIDQDSLFSTLKLSYDSLQNDTMRGGFLCCSLWPQDYEVDKEDLILAWMGLGLIDDFDNINEAYDRGHAVVESLIAASLLESVEGDDDKVKMHDVIRDLALWIACGCGKERNRWLVKARAKLECITSDMICKWGEAKQISVMHNHIGELPRNLPAAYCPNLSVLSLHYNNLRSIPAGFLPCMPNLTFLDLSLNYYLGEIPNEIGCLVQLRYLNLSGTTISSLPDELGQLANLKYLLLGHTYEGPVSIPMRVLSSLSKLEYLDLYPNTELCSSYDDDDDDELTTSLSLLSRLKAVGVKIKSFKNLQQLSHQYQLPIIRLWMEDMGDVSPPNNSSSSSSFHLLHQFNSVTHKSLRQLSIFDCHSISEVVMDLGTTFPRLERLVLRKLENMREIVWRRNVVPSDQYCFPRLRQLTIDKCPLLRNITWISHLPLLQDLYVISCDAMEHLIVIEADGGGEGASALRELETWQQQEQMVNSTITTFPCLRHLYLMKLPRLCDIISSSDYALLNFPCLETVWVEDCPVLKKLPFRPQLNCNKLNKIECSRIWWDSIEWEDEGIKSSLQSLVKFDS